MRLLRIGTRGSALAMAQAGHVADVIRAAGCPVELTVVRTSGDESLAPVVELGVGVFVSALRDALVRGEVDFAVHSYKDLPTAPGAVLQRFASRNGDETPKRAPTFRV